MTFKSPRNSFILRFLIGIISLFFIVIKGRASDEGASRAVTILFDVINPEVLEVAAEQLASLESFIAIYGDLLPDDCVTALVNTLSKSHNRRAQIEAYIESLISHSAKYRFIIMERALQCDGDLRWSAIALHQILERLIMKGNETTFDAVFNTDYFSRLAVLASRPAIMAGSVRSSFSRPENQFFKNLSRLKDARVERAVNGVVVNAVISIPAMGRTPERFGQASMVHGLMGASSVAVHAAGSQAKSLSESALKGNESAQKVLITNLEKENHEAVIDLLDRGLHHILQLACVEVPSSTCEKWAREVIKIVLRKPIQRIVNALKISGHVEALQTCCWLEEELKIHLFAGSGGGVGVAVESSGK